jgi:hypothetical protein
MTASDPYYLGTIRATIRDVTASRWFDGASAVLAFADRE